MKECPYKGCEGRLIPVLVRYGEDRRLFTEYQCIEDENHWVKPARLKRFNRKKGSKK